MEWIALLVPAVITMSVRYVRKNGKTWEWFRYVMEYAIALFVNVLTTQVVITYVLGATGEESGDFVRFAFMTKYLMIAGILAFIMPYIWEALMKAISVSVRMEERHEK